MQNKSKLPQVQYQQNIHNECPTPNGILFIIGGHEQKIGENKKDKNDKKGEARHIELDVLKTFVKLIPKQNPLIVVVTSASSEETKETFNEYKETFQEFCTCEISQIHHETRADLLKDLEEELISQADAVFFCGGDQLKLTSIYGGSKFLTLLKERYIHDKLVIAGTSAGAMALSTPMIYAGTNRNEMIAGNVKITTGLEFMRDVCIDTHFVDRGRFVRMAQVMATNPTSIGIGIEEDTAIIVRKGVDIEIVGNGVIIIINAHKSYGTNITEFNNDKTLSIRNLTVHILSAGETFKLPEDNPPHR